MTLRIMEYVKIYCRIGTFNITGYFHNPLLEIVLEVTLVLAINKKLLSRQIKIIKCITYTVDIITTYILTCLHTDLNE